MNDFQSVGILAALAGVAGIAAIVISNAGGESAAPTVASSRDEIRKLFKVTQASDGQGGQTCIGVEYVGPQGEGETGIGELRKFQESYFDPKVTALVAQGKNLDQAVTVILEDLFPACAARWPTTELLTPWGLLQVAVTQVVLLSFNAAEKSLLEPWERETELEPTPGTEHEAIVPKPPELQEHSGHPAEHCDEPSPDAGGMSMGKDEPAFCVPDPFAVPQYRPREKYVPWPTLPSSSTWPVQTDHRHELVTSYFTDDGKLRGRWGRFLGADRGEQRHAGIDIAGEPGDLVVAPQAGTLLAFLPFYHGAWAAYLLTDEGNVINLGELEKLSWREFGVRPGDRIDEGQPLARLGTMRKSTMLHVEVYARGNATDEDLLQAIRSGHFQWLEDQNPPEGLLDPAPYLLQAATRTFRRRKAQKAMA